MVMVVSWQQQQKEEQEGKQEQQQQQCQRVGQQPTSCWCTCAAASGGWRSLLALGACLGESEDRE